MTDSLRRHLPSLAVLVSALAIGPHAVADSPQWTIDKAASKVAFVAKQMNATAEGEFKAYEADIAFDPDKPEDASITVVIDVDSVQTAHPDVEKEIKKEKWFDVAKFPEARFESQSVKATGPNAYEATGNLTLRDVTREVVLPFDLTVADDPADASKRLAKAKGEITVMRLDFGVGQGEWRATSVLANDVVIRIDIAATSPK